MKQSLTVEELLKPRIKVIAPWPNMAWVGENGFSLDKVFYPVEKHGRYYYNGVDVNKYPHLFRPLQWWEEREEKDMPEHLRYGNKDGVHRIYKVKCWDLHNEEQQIHGAWADEPEDYFLPLSISQNVQPATESEYLTYTQNQIKDNGK